MVYKSRRQLVKEFIDNKVIPAIKLEDKGEEQVINAVFVDTGFSKNIIQEYIDALVSCKALNRVESFNAETGKKEQTILTIPDEEIEDFFKEKKQKEDKDKKDIKEANDFLEQVDKDILGDNKDGN